MSGYLPEISPEEWPDQPVQAEPAEESPIVADPQAAGSSISPGEWPDQPKPPEPEAEFSDAWANTVLNRLDPDEAANILRMSSRTGLEPHRIATDPDMRRLASDQPPNLRAMYQSASNMAYMLQDPRKMAVAKDSISQLAKLEQTIKDIGHSWRVGTSLLDLAEPYARLLDGEDSPELRAKIALAEQQALKTQSESIKSSDPGAKVYSNAAEMLPFMAHSFGEGLKGALLWGSVGALGGAVFGGVGAIPGAITLGKAGLAINVGKAAYRFEGALAYRELLQVQGLDPNIAKWTARAVGILNAGIEVLQIGGIAKMGLQTIKAGMRRAAVKSAMGALPKILARYGGHVTLETAQEIAQEFITIAGVELAKIIDTNQGGPDHKRKTAQEITAQLSEVAKKSAQAFILIGAPGPVAQVAIGASKERQGRAGEVVREAARIAIEAPVTGRAPEVTEELIKNTLEQESALPEKVFVQPGAVDFLFQGAVTEEQIEEAYEAIGIEPETYINAVRTGAEIPIPTEKAIMIAAREEPEAKAMVAALGFDPAEPSKEISLKDLVPDKYLADEFDDEVRGIMAEAGWDGKLKDQSSRILATVLKTRALSLAAATNRDPLEILREITPGFGYQETIYPDKVLTRMRREHIDSIGAEQGYGTSRKPLADPIISWLHGSRLDPQASIEVWGEEETAEIRKNRRHLFKKGGLSPDKALQELQSAGLWDDDPTGEYQSIDRFLEHLNTAPTRTQRWTEFEEAEGRRWDEAQAESDARFQAAAMRPSPHTDIADYIREVRGNPNPIKKSKFGFGFLPETAVRKIVEATGRDREHVYLLLGHDQVGHVDDHHPGTAPEAWRTLPETIAEAEHVEEVPYVPETKGHTALIFIKDLPNGQQRALLGELARQGLWIKTWFEGGPRGVEEWAEKRRKGRQGDSGSLSHPSPAGKGRDVALVSTPPETNIDQKEDSDKGPDELYQAAAYRSESFDPEAEDRLYQWYYSQLQRTIEAKLPGKGTGKSYLQTLRSWAKKGKFKPEEWEWSGLEYWLQSEVGKQKITKGDVLEFLEANQIEVEEVIKGKRIIESGEVIATASILGDNDERLSLELLHDPDRQDYAWYDEDNNIWGEPGANEAEAIRNLDIEYRGSVWGLEFDEEPQFVLPGGSPKFLEWADESGKNYRELLLTWPENISAPYQGHHWDEPNVLAHVRFAEVADGDGEKVLLIEEIQSDWHQKGRKKGYSSHALGYAAEDDGTVPDAPFKKTWPLLAFKRMIRWAAENGYQRIAWTTGEQQVERYNLAKYVDTIGYSLRGKQANITVWSTQGQTVYQNQSASKETLEETIGHELTEKVFSGEGRKEGEITYLEGLDLEVGGEGMKAFYDKMLPKMVQKFVKKWGGKVGIAGIDGDVEAFSEENLRVAAHLARNKDDIPAARYLLTLADHAHSGKGVPEYALEDAPDGSMGYVEEAERLERGDKRKYWMVDVTPKMEAAALGGLPLFQNEVRGMTRFADGQATIIFSRESDPTTVVHELGHVFRRQFASLYTDPSIPQWMRDDYETLCSWVGADPLADWTEKQEEKFATGFEKYMASGEAPSPELRGIFRQIRKWALKLYYNLNAMGVNVTPEVKSVFDRMLATDAEIEAVKKQNEIRPMFGEKPEWMTKEDWLHYRRVADQAETSVEEEVYRLWVKELNAAKKGWRKEARELFDADPIQQAITALSDLGGLNLEELKNTYSPEIVAAIRAQKRGGKPLARQKGPVFLAEAAEQVGMTEDEALEAIGSAPTKTQFIAAYLAEQEQTWRIWADPVNLTMTPEVTALYGLEEALLDPAQGQAVEPRPATNEHSVTVGKIEHDWPDTERAAEAAIRRSASAARELYRSGDRSGARKEKARQKELAAQKRERAKIREEYNKAIRYFKRVKKSKQIDPDYMGQIEELLAQYHLGGRTQKTKDKHKSLREFVADLEDRGELVTIPDKYIAEANQKPLKDVSLADLRGLVEAVQNLEHLGKTKSKLLASKAERDFSKAKARLIDAAAKRRQRKTKEIPMGREKKTGADHIKSWTSSLLKPEFILRRLDGAQAGGEFQEIIFETIKHAEDQGLRLGSQAMDRIRLAFEAFPRAERRKWSKIRHRIPGLPRTFTTEERLMVALNSGTWDNYQKLASGYQSVPGFEWWSEASVEAILATITPEEWGLVTEVWGAINDLFPALAKAHERASGVKLHKIEGREFQTAQGGVVQGQYFPLVYNPKASKRVEGFEAKKEAQAVARLFESSHGRPSTRAGATHERVKASLPVRLDFGVIVGHVKEVVHDASHRAPVRDVYKLLNDQEVQTSIESVVGEAKYRELINWVRHVANPARSEFDATEYFVSLVRRNTTMAMLGLKISVALKQTLSLTQTIQATSLKETLAGMAEFYASPRRKEMIREIHEKSPAMAARRQTWDRDLAELADQAGPLTPSRWKQAQDSVFVLIGLMDAIATYPTWMTGYRRALNEGKGEQAAVDAADRLVRTTQPAASPKDLAGIQKGSEFKKLGTMFYTFFSVFYNRFYEAHAKMREGGSIWELARAYWWLNIVPVVLADMLAEWDVPDDQDDLERLGKGAVLYYLAGIPFLRDVLGTLLTGFDYAVSPAAGVGQAVKHLGFEIKDSAEGDPDPEALFKKGLETAGYFTGLPTRQAMITMRGIEDFEETGNPAWLLVRKPYEEE